MNSTDFWNLIISSLVGFEDSGFLTSSFFDTTFLTFVGATFDSSYFEDSLTSSVLATFFTTGEGIEFVFFTLRVGVLDADGYFFSGDAGCLGVLLTTFFTFLLLVEAVLFCFWIASGDGDLIGSGTLLRSSLLGDVWAEREGFSNLLLYWSSVSWSRKEILIKFLSFLFFYLTPSWMAVPAEMIALMTAGLDSTSTLYCVSLILCFCGVGFYFGSGWDFFFAASFWDYASYSALIWLASILFNLITCFWDSCFA